VTVAVYVPAEPEQERVDVPEPVEMLDGLTEQDRPVDGLAERARVTVPPKPLIGVTVIVEVPVEPAETVTLVGLAVTEKSGTATL
jgi:hypothetical protein